MWYWKPIHKKYSFIEITGKPYYFLSPLIPHEAVVSSFFNFETWFWEKKVLQVIDTFLKRTHKREWSQKLRDGARGACICYEVISSSFLRWSQSAITFLEFPFAFFVKCIKSLFIISKILKKLEIDFILSCLNTLNDYFKS